MPRAITVLLCAVLLSAKSFAGDSLTIAIASNFKNTADEIVQEFTAATSIPVRVSAGSTGKLYAQIIHGAPYDVFLSADARRPELLEASHRAIAGSRSTYAIGRLVLWSRDDKLRGKDCRSALENHDFRWLAIANPETAPYGRAAKEFLQAANLWDDVSGQLVRGENVSQALQFVVTRNATLGFVAASQTNDDSLPDSSCAWQVPPSMHAPILQQGVVLASSRNQAAAWQFLRFLQGTVARDILHRRGYGTVKP
jgi:molybdate transport system substrate-binding protein